MSLNKTKKLKKNKLVNIKNNNETKKTNIFKIKKRKKEQLNKIKKLAMLDAQINTSGKFSEFTDFQNIMISDLAFLELLWEGDEDNLKRKTISELYLESLNKYNMNSIEYEKLVFNANEMLEMAKLENRKKYRSLVLGKLVRYGFSDIKIQKKISGNDGFDAFILKDIDNNIMLHFPCTNLVETADYMYDSYPILESISNKTGKVGNLMGGKKIYDSQQTQAKEVLNECIKKISNKSKIIISGFSLGGSLAEVSYLNNYNKYSDKISDIILFNPYHNRLTNSESLILKSSGKLKLYATEGDVVSTVFNYNDLNDVTKTIYIDYNNGIKNGINQIDNNSSVLNLVVQFLKNKYCDNTILACEKIKAKTPFNFPLHASLKGAILGLKTIKKTNIDATKLLSRINSVVGGILPILKKFGYDINERYNLEFLQNLKYIEIMFTNLHLTYTVDINKKVSFDKNGKVRTKIEFDGVEHKLEYPSFTKTTTQLLGSDPYNELTNIANDFLKKKER